MNPMPNTKRTAVKIYDTYTRLHDDMVKIAETVDKYNADIKTLVDAGILFSAGYDDSCNEMFLVMSYPFVQCTD